MADPRRERLRIEVEGLHCVGCAETLREAVGQLPGLELARADVDRRSLVADVDTGKTDRERLR